MSANDKGCEGCRLLCRQDVGFSEWTITGTDLWCIRKANPHLPVCDESISSRKMEQILAFGETCPLRVAGVPQWFGIYDEVPEEFSR